MHHYNYAATGDVIKFFIVLIMHQTLILVNINITITPSGPIIIAESRPERNFSLVCSADVSINAGPPPILEWFYGPENSSLPSDVVVSNVTNNGNNYTSALQFSPLRESHTGTYTCRVGYAATSIVILPGGKEITIMLIFTMKLQLSFSACIILDPTINISSVGTNTAGGKYSLTCMVTAVGIDKLIGSYNWTKNNGTAQIVVGNSSTIFFSFFKLSDAGQYLCQVTIGSQIYDAIKYINTESRLTMYNYFLSKLHNHSL